MEPVNPILSKIPLPPFDVINPHTNRLIVKVTTTEVKIFDKLVQYNIRGFGINVPPFLQERFNGVSSIYQGDPLFYEAFITAGCWQLIRGGYAMRPIAVPESLLPISLVKKSTTEDTKGDTRV